MSLKRITGLLGLTALAATAAPFAAAQAPAWYVGASLGEGRANLDDPRIASGLLAGGLTTRGIDDRDSSTGGYRFNRYFALEGGYFDLGKFGYTATTLPAGSLTGDLRYRGFNLDAVASLPFTARFSAFARIGATSGEAKDTFTGTGAVTVLVPNPSQRSTNFKFGGGLQYDLTRHVGLRAELERYRLDDAISNKGDLDLASLGLVIRFGGRRVAAAPAPWAPPVAQSAPVRPIQPAPAQITVLPRTQAYCSILDLQFDIDKDDIQGDDLEKLKVLGTFMAKYPDTTAVIEGHTDNVGSDDHNLRLSRLRAESVVNYLVASLHIDRARLSAVGYGDTRPLYDNATEEGKRMNRRIDAVIPCATDIEGLKVMPARVTMAMLIEYDENQTDIKPDYDPELRKVANYLKANPSVKATIEGHTGNLKGSPEAAVVISRQRAENVVTYLVDHLGIDRARLTAEGFGKSRRFAYNTSLEGQQENRRVNIIFHYPKS